MDEWIKRMNFLERMTVVEDKFDRWLDTQNAFEKRWDDLIDRILELEKEVASFKALDMVLKSLNEFLDEKKSKLLSKAERELFTEEK